MTKVFDDQLLEDFAHGFYGYGNYDGQYWFIGMEEGGGNSFEEITKRLNVWKDRGKRELEDIAEYHAGIGMTDFFNASPKIQPTWNKLIRILLSSRGNAPTTEQVREYQREALGRQNGDTCLVELLPLPSPAVGRWPYLQHSQLPYLADREMYKKTFVAPRIDHLRQRINERKPKTVVFYGLGYLEHWLRIAEVASLLESDGTLNSHNKSSLFVLTKHPAAKGVTNEYFHEVGRMISARQSEL